MGRGVLEVRLSGVVWRRSGGRCRKRKGDVGSRRASRRGSRAVALADL